MEPWRSEAARPQADGLQYHIRCRPGDVAPYVLLPGDPDRVPLIAALWDQGREVARHREFTTYTGRFRGTPISCTSTGIGGPSSAIAVEELAEVGGSVLVRVGTCGALQPGIECGDLIVVTGAVRYDGTSDHYVAPPYPAVAHHEVVLALIEAAERLGVRYHVGICASTAAFHTGQGRPGFGGYTQSWTEARMADLQQARVLAFEMEAATLFTLASLFGLRAGAVLAVVANRLTNELRHTGIEEAGRAACLAVHVLSGWDGRSRASGHPGWRASIG